MWWVVNATVWRFTPGSDPVPIVWETGWAPGAIWTGAENLSPAGFDALTAQPVASGYTDYAVPAYDRVCCATESLYLSYT